MLWRLLVALCLISTSLAVSAAQAESQPACSTGIFSSAWSEEIPAELTSLAVTASVFDTRTNCWYHYEPNLILTTASAVKLQVLAANLDRVERANRSLTASERSSAERMLWYSHNSPPASALYVAVGASGMQAFGTAVGATSSTHTSVYGATVGPASDFTKVALATLNMDLTSPLTVESRQVARDLLAGVHFTQRFGVSAGLPTDHDVWLKNGFFPCTRCAPFSGAYTWRVASTGYVERPDSTGWAITVMTDGAQTQAEGVQLVEFFAAHVAEHLADGQAASRPLDRANCVTAAPGETASSIVHRLHLPSSAWSDVRWVSGNEGPMRGQLLCDPNPFALTRSCICPPRRSGN